MSIRLSTTFQEEVRGKAGNACGKPPVRRERGRSESRFPRPQAEKFHHSTAQLLFISLRTRRDLQTTVLFLTTRVKGPDTDDWGKLRRAMKYLNETRRLKLRLKICSIEDVIYLLWFTNASHCVHWDSRGHGGAALMMGKGAMVSYSNRIEVNTRSSFKTEVVAVDRYMPEVLWTMYFLREEGYSVHLSKIAQDNEA